MSSDASIDPEELDSEQEHSPGSQFSEHSTTNSTYSDREIVDGGVTPSIDSVAVSPNFQSEASPLIDSISATPSIYFESTPAINFASTASINFDATPSTNYDATEVEGADVSREDQLIVPREQSDSVPESQPDLLDILSEAVTRVENLPIANNRNNPVPFPLSRVKTIMRTDPDTSLVQTDATVVVGEAAKLFLKRISRDAHKITADSKRKIINRADVDTCVNRYQEYLFLEEQLDW